MALGSVKLVAALFLAMLLLSFAAHRGLWGNEFYKDDYEWLTIAMDIVASPRSLFTPDPMNSEYVLRTTQRLLVACTYAATGTRARGYYLVGLILHAGAATLLFLLIRALYVGQVGRNALALLGALFFVTSSCHQGGVVWMSAQSTLLVTNALLLLFLFVVHNAENLNRPRSQVIVAIVYAAALVSKKSAVVFPLLLASYFLIVHCEHREPRSSRLQRCLRQARGVLALSSAMAVGMLLFARYAVGDPKLSRMWPALEDASFGLSFNMLHNVAGAFLGCFLPAPFYYERFQNVLPFQLAALLLALAFALLLRSASCPRRSILFGLTWMLVASLPASLFNYVQYEPLQLTTSRYYYLPMVGASIVVAGVARAVLARWQRLHWCGTLSVLFGIAHAALHSYEIEATRRTLHDYTVSRRIYIETALQVAKRQAPRGSILHARNWPFATQRVPRIGRIFFEPHGYELHNEEPTPRRRDDVDAARFILERDLESNYPRLVPLSSGNGTTREERSR
ncbi:MAG: hypothetical protein JSW67_04615 [Candidatus Latescibacterota bacterium]|nr:MAG: hypothetical protein JSW67_04615 [Candidatus Latescibacterota bacterium]